MMTPEQIVALKAHFLEWSGGFEPESDYQITVYIDYAADAESDPVAIRRVLAEWMAENQPA